MADKSDTSAGLTQEERDAVKQRAKELREQEKAGKNRAAGEKSARASIPQARRKIQNWRTARTCSASSRAYETNTRTVSTTGTGSGSNVVSTAGTYQWLAHYSGDTNNDPNDSACGAEAEIITAATHNP